ncbi:MAG: lipid-A-disaccharide synthase [Alphaproteobacteria bacterium]|nr:lipid-A-disaccharide synthase [Alphaproteobacteria bacterium]
MSEKVPDKTPCFFLVACEPSGDLLGARLMAALKKLFNGKVRFEGVGGERMQAEGLNTLFQQSELALFGLVELLPKIPHVLKRLKETVEAAKRIRPDAVVTIDGPDFCFRLAKQLKSEKIPLIHYVAPTVWAWRPGRAKKIAKIFDHLLAILPFEPPYFEKVGLPCTFVGHTVTEGGADKGDADRFYKEMNIPRNMKIITVLPGSRRSEIKRLAPVFAETLKQLQPLTEGFKVIVPTVPQILDFIGPYLKNWPIKPLVLIGDQQKYDAFAASHVALAASGTVAVELALAKTPHIIAYKLNPITVLLYRWFIKVKYANLTNLLLNRPVVPEFLQQFCTPEAMSKKLFELWSDAKLRQDQRKAFDEIKIMLRNDDMPPSEKAARVVCEVANVQIR